MATILPTLRLAALGTVVIFSVIVLGMASHVTFLTNTFVGGYYSFAALGIATAILSVVSLSIMIVVDRVRKGAFTSMIAVEIAWLGFLWILWLSTAATATEASIFTFFTGCNFKNSDLETACHEFSAIQAFSFLNWIILLAYTLTLFALSLIAANRGHHVWSSSVQHTDFNAPAPQQFEDKAIVPQPMQPIYPVQVGTTQLSQYPPSSSTTPGWAGQPQSIPV